MSKLILNVLVLLLINGCASFSANETKNRTPASDRGKRIGNGGGACVCRNANNEITFAEILDFSEAETKYNVKIKKDDREVNIQVNEALEKIKFHKFLYEEIKKELAKQDIISKFVNDKETLTSTNDFISRVCETKKDMLGNSCKYEQLAVYSDVKSELLFSKEIHSKLNTENLAGIKLHEAIYKVDRKYIIEEKINSEFTKEVVSNLFSDNFDENKVSKIIDSHYENINNSFKGIELLKNKDGKFQLGYYQNGKFNFINKDVYDDYSDLNDSYYIIKANTLYGLINKYKGIIIQPMSSIKPTIAEDGLFKIKQTYYFLIDEEGKQVSQYYEFLGDFIDGLAVFRNKNNQGVLDINENIVFTTQYKLGENVSEGLVGFESNGKFGFLNLKGEIAIEPMFSKIGYFSKEKLAPAGVDDNNGYSQKLGYINTSGNFIIQPQYNIANEFHEGFASVGSDDINLAFINTSNKRITDFSYEIVNYFTNGKAIVNYKGIKNPFYLNKNGQIYPKNNYNLNSIVGVARVHNSKKPIVMSFCKTDGEWCRDFEFKYNELSDWVHTNKNGDDNFRAQLTQSGNYCGIYLYKTHTFNLSYGMITLDGRYIDTNFDFQAPYDSGSIKYDDVLDPSKCVNGGFVKVKVKNKFVFSDGYGKVYDEVRPFQNDLAAVKINGKWGFINHSGLLVIGAIFDKVIDDFNEKGFARIWVLSHEEEFISDLNIPGTSNKFKMNVGGRTAIINKKGVIIKYEN